MRRSLLIGAGATLLATLALVARHQTALPHYDRTIIHLKISRAGLGALAASLLAEPTLQWVAFSDDDGVVAGSASQFRVDLSDATRQQYQASYLATEGSDPLASRLRGRRGTAE